MWTYNNTNNLYHFGVKGMKWGFRRGNRSNGDIILDYTGKRISRASSRSGYRGGQTPGTSALLPAVVTPKTNTHRRSYLPSIISPKSMSVPTSKVKSTVINAGSKFMSKKLKVGLTVAALTAATGAAVAIGVKSAKKRKAKRKEGEQ